MKNSRFFFSMTPDQQRKFMDFAAAYGNAYTRGNDTRDERLLSLPHHKRIAMNDAVALEARFLEEFAPAVIAEAKRFVLSFHLFGVGRWTLSVELFLMRLLFLQLPRLDPDVTSPGENLMPAAACRSVSISQ